MWTTENRHRYDRDRLRYPSDLTEAEWQLIEPLMPPAKRGGGKRRGVMREVVNGVMYVLSTGCQWRYVPQDLPPRSTVKAISAAGAGTARWRGSTMRSTSSAASRLSARSAPPPV
jgi:transposase